MTFEKAKELNIVEVAKQFLTSDYGLHQVGNEWRCKSISEPGENNTCTTIYTDTNSYYDFKTKHGGDAVDFLATLKDITQTEALQLLTCETGFFTKNSKRPEWLKQLERLQNACEKAHQNLKNYPKVLKYLYSRRLNDDFIEKMKIGVAPENWLYGNDSGEIRLWLPYFDRDGKICYLATRSLDKVGLAVENSPKYKKLWIGDNSPFNLIKQPLLGLNSIKREKDTLIICEGIFDAYSWLQEGYSCLCFVCGDSGEDNNNIILETAKKFRKVIFTFDNDAKKEINSGEKFSNKLTKKFLDEGLMCFTVRDYSGDLKDVSDYYSVGGSLKQLEETAQNAPLFYMACVVRDNPFRTNISELKKQIKTEYRRVESVLYADNDLKTLDTCIKQNYGKKFFEEISAKQSKDDIVKDLTEKFTAETPVIGTGTPNHENYFVYKSNHWQIKDVVHIHKYVEEKFNCTESIYQAVARRLLVKKKEDTNDSALTKERGIIWNNFHGFNFQNGIFDYDTGTLLPHSPEYHFSFIAPFCYDPKARNEVFEKWIEEVMNYNKSRIQTFRDMLGHILIADKSKSQYHFNLIGEKGANGKSTLKEILEGILGSFVTATPLARLGSPTEIMRLFNSLVNFSSESSTTINKATCASIKSISSGETIEGNYKFRDSVKFKPRATLISSFNEMPNYAETSPAFKRRTIFIQFEKSFLGHEDKNIVSKILADKAGLFNYLYQCYLDLKANNFAVRTCSDQNPLMKEMILESNVVAQFLDEFIADLQNKATTIVTTTLLHEFFIKWLDATRDKKTSKSASQLTKEIKKLTGLDTFQISAGELRGKRAFNFSPLLSNSEEQIKEDYDKDFCKKCGTYIRKHYPECKWSLENVFETNDWNIFKTLNFVNETLNELENKNNRDDAEEFIKILNECVQKLGYLKAV